MKNDIILLFAPIVADVNLHVEYYEAYEVGERLTSTSFIHSALTWIFIYGWENFALKTIAYGQVNSLFYLSRVSRLCCFDSAKWIWFGIPFLSIADYIIKVNVAATLFNFCLFRVMEMNARDLLHIISLHRSVSMLHTILHGRACLNILFVSREMFDQVALSPYFPFLALFFSFVTLNCFEIEWRVSFFRRFKLLGSAGIRFCIIRVILWSPFCLHSRAKNEINCTL